MKKIYFTIQSAYECMTYINKKIYCLISLIFTILSCSCSLDSDIKKDQIKEEIWFISNRTEYRKVYQFHYTRDLDKEIECLIINNGDSYIPINGIKDFVYERGYTYKIIVSIIYHANSPQDSGNKTYNLKKIIYKK